MSEQRLSWFSVDRIVVLIFVTFLVNIFTSAGLKFCAPGLHKIGSNNAHLLLGDAANGNDEGVLLSAAEAPSPVKVAD